MRGVFRKAQVANVNIYAIDPAGINGYQDYLRRHPLTYAARQRPRAPRATNIRQLQDHARHRHHGWASGDQHECHRPVVAPDL
jgi:hypothetical protein